MPIVLETFEEFVKEQGCEYLQVNDFSSRGESQHFIFENGAQSDGLHQHVPPPDEPTELSRLRLRFLRKKLEAEITSYRHVKSSVADQLKIHQMNAGPMPTPGWQEHLQQKSVEIETLQNEVQKIIESLPETEQQLERARQRAERTNAARDAMYKLNEFANY